MTRKAWTFMVYMAGDNDLDSHGVVDLHEMKRAGSTDRVSIVAQLDRARGHAARRYYLTRGTRLDGDTVQDVGRVDTGDPAALIDFVDWATTAYPAERYALVLWNHGEGWDDTDLWDRSRPRRFGRLTSRPVRHALFRSSVRPLLEPARLNRPETRAILIDEDAKDFLDNQEMVRVLAAVKRRLRRKLDLLGMDACLMSMAEVGYECRLGAACSVGSTETEPLDGWPYHTILGSLVRQPRMAPQALGRLIVRKYMQSYGRDDQVTQSALDLGQADRLATAVRSLATALLAGLRQAAFRQTLLVIRARVQYFDEDGDNIDLVDFCTLLGQATGDPAIRAACTEVIRTVTGGLVLASGARGDDLRHAHGLSIYFPKGRVSPLYPRLAFSRRTRWDRFLRAYTSAIRRR